MRRATKAAVAVAVAGTALVLMSGVAGAQDAPPTIDDVNTAVGTTATSLNLLWVVIGAVLVIFMQAGFALVETGFCRAKHAAHVVSTNFAIFGLGFIAFFVCGFAFAFSGFSYASFGLTESIQSPSTSGLIGSGEWVFLWGKSGYFLSGINQTLLPAAAAFFLFMMVFMDTTATIPTGTMAERWAWKNFFLYGLFGSRPTTLSPTGCGAAAGWRSRQELGLGFGAVDFAGSGVVHTMGGIIALAGAISSGRELASSSRTASPGPFPAITSPWSCWARSSCFRLVRVQRRFDFLGHRPMRTGDQHGLASDPGAFVAWCAT